MDGPVMPATEQACRHRFIEPLGCDGGLEPGERGLTFQVSEVLEDTKSRDNSSGRRRHHTAARERYFPYFLTIA